MLIQGLLPSLAAQLRLNYFRASICPTAPPPAGPAAGPTTAPDIGRMGAADRGKNPVELTVMAVDVSIELFFLFCY